MSEVGPPEEQRNEDRGHCEDLCRDRAALARSTVKYYAAWSFGAGLVAIPVVEMLAVVGVQVQMLRKLSDIYGVEFSEHVARNVLMALLGGIAAETVGAGIARPLVRSIPGIGTILSVLTVPAVSVASTYAVGEVFIQHFEKGGSLLDFRSESMKEKFKSAYNTVWARSSAQSN